MKLILFPLSVLILVALLSIMGLGGDAYSFNGSLYDHDIGPGGYEGWYDADGHMVMYNNMTAAGENGRWKATTGGYFFQVATENQYSWFNGTWPFEQEWDIYNTPSGYNSKAYADTGFNLTDSLGLLALVGAVMALATIAGIRIMGSGVSETSVRTLILGSGLITIWLLFSVVAMSLIVQIPLFGPVMYFAISLMYTVGVIGKISGDDE